MSKEFVISDLHLGHKNILSFTKGYRQGTNVEEHDEWIIDQWNSVVGYKDIVYCLGDLSFTTIGFKKCSQLKGQKKLLLGNHDTRSMKQYMDMGFAIMPGLKRTHNHWLSHAPIHPDQLRGCNNIHGHTHQTHINDPRYINVSVEACQAQPVNVETILDGTYKYFEPEE